MSAASDPTRQAEAGRRPYIERARREASRLGRWITLVSLGLLVCLWVAIIVSNQAVLDSTAARTRAAATNLAAEFCLDMANTLQTVEAAMDLTAREIRENPSGFSLDRWAKELPALAHPTIYVTWVDPKGRLVSTTLRSGAAGIDFSDREHIRVHMKDPDPGMFVSTPVIGRISGRETLQVTKRVDDASGKILGILVFILAADNLTQLHRMVDIGPHGVIALVGLDGRLRARFNGTPDGAPEAIEQTANSSWPRELVPGPAEKLVVSGSLDNVPRIFALSRLPAYGLFVAAGLGEDDELAAARTQATKMIGIGVAASVLLAVLNVLLIREIRRRARREAELAHEREELEGARTALMTEQSKLAAMNKELVISSERAESASLAKSQFLAQMSHELRTPLHAVIGFSELIANHEESGTDSGRISNYANDITRAGRHLLELINSILDLSKVESGTATLSESYLDLSDIIEECVATVRVRARDGGVGLTARVPRDIPRVRADGTKLKQIFLNLLSNAVKFTPQGGSVSIATRPAPDGEYVVSFADTGIGMTDAELAVALEPFGQVENSLSRSFEGTGLGLPLARRLIEMHGGRLTLYSVKNVGTTVEVTLPADRIVRTGSDRSIRPDTAADRDAEEAAPAGPRNGAPEPA